MSHLHRVAFRLRGLQHPFIPSLQRTCFVLVTGEEWNMADKVSKVWEPYSKMGRMEEEDWAGLESVYNDYRYRQGDLQRTEFIKRVLGQGGNSYLYQLKSTNPGALSWVSQARTTL